MGSNATVDVAIVGGGPAGCSAGIFLGRADLEVVVFDRGRSSLQRCAHLENYPGFPRGIDVETFYGLLHEHVEVAGCDLRPELVESVDRLDGGRFLVSPQEGDSVAARRVIAATRYDGEYLRGLDDDEALFTTSKHGGETSEFFDREYPARDGATPVDGLYVASPSAEADAQVVLAAARGARVARRVLADERLADGWWEAVAERVDWMRREAELDDEWLDRDTWLEWFDEYYGADAPVATDAERYQRVRAAYVDDGRSAYLTDEEVDARARAGQVALASRLDVDVIVEAVGERCLLEAIDDDVLREYLESEVAASEEVER